MRLENYSQTIKYTTNLDYPKEFYLVLPRPRRGSPTPDQRKLEPLCVGEYIHLPIDPRPIGENGEILLNGSYRVVKVEGNHVSLELIHFRMTHTEAEQQEGTMASLSEDDSLLWKEVQDSQLKPGLPNP